MTARYLAVRALCHQDQQGFANLVLDGELKRAGLTGREAAFCTGIFYTVLERRRLLDAVLAQFSKMPPEKMDPPVRNILRSGLAQAKYLGVPVSAAVNESVKLARAFGKSSAAGMVNAVLRRAVSFDENTLEFKEKQQRLAVMQSLSDDVAALLLAQYGDEAFELAAATYDRRPTAIRVNTLKTNSDALAGMLAGEGATTTAGPWPGSLLVQFEGSPAATKAFGQGLFHVQGIPSQLAALSVNAGAGQRVLDLCAAPGGKSVTIAQQMGNSGTLLSCDATERRAGLIRRAFDRCGITCGRTLANDAATFRPELAVFDRVLCDVPCSGLGIMGKKPDIRYKDLAGTEELCGLQAKILKNGARYLAQNGRLVYSTCTVNRAENEDQIRAFLAENGEFHVLAPYLALEGAEDTGFGTLFLPHRTGTDGFFIAVLERK
ncbi:MAG: 16S rRNA (cytosine(967)-C(5))-methyltransferase RsmB [Gemmiger sp.]